MVRFTDNRLSVFIVNLSSGFGRWLLLLLLRLLTLLLLWWRRLLLSLNHLPSGARLGRGCI